MKTIKLLLSVFLLSILVISCSGSDDEVVDNSTKVRYQISELDSYVSHITYKNGAGANIDLSDYTQFADDGVDSKTVSLASHPFDAHMEVTVTNTSPSSQTYTLVIYVDGEVKDFAPFMAPANSTYTKQIDYTVP